MIIGCAPVGSGAASVSSRRAAVSPCETVAVAGTSKARTDTEVVEWSEVLLVETERVAAAPAEVAEVAKRVASLVGERVVTVCTS